MLYPVPNVFDAVADMVARAVVRAAREIDVPMMPVFAVVRAVRALFADVALRAELDCIVFFAVRAVVVVLRVVAARDGDVVLRDVTVPLRAVVAVPRVVVVDVDVAADCRLMLDASRTAALATPMPTASVPTKSKNFFILMWSMISKSVPRGNE